MQYDADTVAEYIEQLPEERKDPVEKLRQTVKENLPKGFEEGITYKMIGFYVPHSIYPAGYHCNPKDPLPFINIASQKNFVALYHSGIYAKQELLDWFVAEFPKHSKYKLDMGKSCVRFKKVEAIPYDLIAELCQKMTVEEWIDIYDTARQKR
ncbi:DUF1801 domain-containing protein [Aureisphaera galaxeae]|uniref:DUF1801 domain-containing protein n=1 Tax=Aureisphaera galaxeae TaxID=1538023 RepID=UPI0023507CF1|nr:DUF1801 domain-containing protein [Aureisphaera galaxeae]MDC8005984.1 DUF1801 domain-containing protein [Aureisphaera galaxeae]